MGAVQALQIELERHFRQRLVAGRQRRRHVNGHRQQTAQVEVGGVREVGRQQRQRNVGRVGRASRGQALADALRCGLHGDGAAAAVVVRRNGTDPVAQMRQRPGREFKQRRLGCALVGEVAVVELLTGPGGVAKLLEPDHARAALERVERAPQRGERRNVGGCAREFGVGGGGSGQHLLRFFQKNLAHLVVVGEIGTGVGVGKAQAHRRGHPAGRTLRLQAHRVRRGRHEVGQRIGKIAARMGQLVGVLRRFERFLRSEHGGGQRRLIGGLRFVRQALEIARHVFDRHVFAARRDRQQLGLFDQARVDRRRAGGARRVHFAAAHDRAQGAGFGVIAEQRFRHLRLHAEHVDQEPQRAEVAGQAVEHTGLVNTGWIDFGRHQTIDLVAHAQQGVRSVVHAQHREHAAHGRELVGHRNQHIALDRVAEVLVDQLLGFGERRAQFLHHAAHRLPIGDAPVQLFHPRFERVGRAALAHAGQALGQTFHTQGLLGVVELRVFECGLDVEQARRHFHRQRCRRCGAGLLGLGHGLLQFNSEGFAEREQALERIANERELFREACQAVHLATGDRRPGFLGGGHAFACLSHERWVEAAERAHGVVGRRVFCQAIDLAHCGQAGRMVGRAGRSTLGAEEEQVLGEPLGQFRFAALEDSVLRQQPRCHALAEHIEAEQALGLGFEHGRSQLPEVAGRCLRGAGAEPGADVAHALGHRQRVGRTHHRQQQRFERGVGRGIGLARDGFRVGRQVAPLPVDGPQVGRVHTVGAGRFLHRAVLREQRQRGHRLAGQHAVEVVEQRERGALDVVDHQRGELVRLAHITLHRGFAGAQHHGRGRQAHEFERTHALVDLGARAAQHGRVDGFDVGAGERFGFFDETAQRFVRRIERAAQLFVHPRQGAEVVTGFADRRVAGHRAHRRAHRCWGRLIRS